MTKEELAKRIDGRDYGGEIKPDEELIAKQSRLVVIFGASDDLCELRGAIHDELGAYLEALIMIDKDGKLLREIEDDDMEVLKKYDALGKVQAAHAAAVKIKSLWCKTKLWAWTYETEFPHATFEIFDDGERYSRGIVIDLKEIS